jgi:8-amino-7-oxononanoate synthase
VRFVVERQVRRALLVEGRWLADFASCNYLGLDLDAEVRAAIAPMVDQWGTHPSWTRAVASPNPYVELEAALAELVGVDDTVVFPSVTLVHLGVLPRLAGPNGAILLDSSVHHSVQEAAALAGARGTSVATWRHGDLDDLDRALRAQRARNVRVIAVDGVYSMSGSLVDLPGVVAVAAAHDAIVYVDDAHGIGLLGERPSAEMPYGSGGGGVARHFAARYDRLVYVGGLSKAFSSMAAFVTCTGGLSRSSIEAASTLVFSGPIPVASLATALAGLRVNRVRGDVARGVVHRLTRRLLDGLVDAGFELDGHRAFPIVNVVLGGPDVVLGALEDLWQAGIVVTPSVFPAAPLLQGGVRFTPTAANTVDEVDRAVSAMAAVRRRLVPASTVR